MASFPHLSHSPHFHIIKTDGIAPIFKFQVITYLKLYNKNPGYLINFNVPLLKDGFKRIVYNF